MLFLHNHVLDTCKCEPIQLFNHKGSTLFSEVYVILLESLTELAWGDWKAMAISLSQDGLKIPRSKELVARARKIMQEKMKPSRNCQF